MTPDVGRPGVRPGPSKRVRMSACLITWLLGQGAHCKGTTHCAPGDWHPFMDCSRDNAGGTLCRWAALWHAHCCMSLLHQNPLVL